MYKFNCNTFKSKFNVIFIRLVSLWPPWLLNLFRESDLGQRSLFMHRLWAVWNILINLKEISTITLHLNKVFSIENHSQSHPVCHLASPPSVWGRGSSRSSWSAPRVSSRPPQSHVSTCSSSRPVSPSWRPMLSAVPGK